jgi:dTDP-glucose 4,6-dehydratase
MQILVTGGLGFIGSNFIEHILNKNPDVTVTNVDKCDYMAREKNVKSNPRYTYIKGDITEKFHMSHIFTEFKPDVVVHFAAQSHVDNSFASSFDFTKDNVLGTHVLLDAALKYGKLKKFIHISTDEVYGEVAPGAVSNVNSLFNPTNPYAASKAAAELYVKAYAHSFRLPCIVTRGNNVFGPKQYPEKLIPLFIKHILNDTPCEAHGNGATRRNFIHVDDVSRALETIIDKGVIGETYNIGTNNEFSVIDIFEKLTKIMGKGKINFVPDRPYNDSRYCIDSSALCSLGWREDDNFDSKLRDTVQWYQDHPDWYK